ncbi:hypothetical protein [Kiloniella majae]|uniref:hypothetical protein n=1 Tax=Kiloniella majae TaxID=1938558 RepID=UPI000A276F51|nr:hypothetical protein [Kiloniella majae]
MPIFDDKNTQTSLSIGINPGSNNSELEPEFFKDTLPAAFRLENTIGSFLTNKSQGPIREIDADYDVFSDIEGYEQYAERFANSRDPVDTTLIKKRIDRELKDRRTLGASGFAGTAAEFAAGLFDPVNLIPVGGQAYRTYRVGGSILKGALTTARAGFIGSTAAEALLYNTQELRTVEESASNIAAATFLSGVLGGSVGAVRDAINAQKGGNIKSWQELQKTVENDLTVPDEFSPDITEPNSINIKQDELVADTGADVSEELLDADDLPKVNRPELAEGGSVGAASLRENVAEERLKSALGVEKVLSFQDPMLRLATSSSIEARRIIQELAETPMAYEKNALGVATPIGVETRVKMYQAPLYESLKFMDDAFVRYRLGRNQKFGDIAKLGARDLIGFGERRKLDYAAFRKEVSFALRRSDQHQIPEVAEAAKEFRSKVFDPAKKKAIEVGLLPENVTVETAPSYLTRMYDHQKIAARRDEFTEVVARWLKTQEEQVGFDDLDLLDLADEITDRILGTPDGRLPYDAHIESRRMEPEPGVSVRGPLRAREFPIPDKLIEDFLENDIAIVAKSYTRTMAPDVEITAQFGSIGMDEQLGAIRREFAQKAGAAQTKKARKKLQEDREAAIRDISAVRDRIRGDYGMPSDPNSIHVRLFRNIRNLNYIRLLGGMTLSAIPDIARPIMVHGFNRVFGAGFVPMVKNFKAYRIASNEVKLAGTALDMVLDSRSMAIADVLDNFGRQTVVERGLQAATDRFGKVALMAPWNAAMKQFSGIITMTRMIQASDAIRNGGGKAKEVEKLASQGIDQSMAVRISEQFEQFGEISDGIYMANTSQWIDKDALEAFRAGLVKEVDKIIITPGQDKPLWMSTETGKVIGQFKSFGLASTQRALLSGLQDRDLNALQGAAFMVGLGSLSYAFKTWDAGREVSDDPTVWLAEGVDRSGLTGWLFEANNVMEKVSRGTVGVSALTGGPQMSRYQSRNILGSLVGPTAGTIKDLSQAVGSATSGDWTQSDSRALRRLLPYQNLMGMRQVFDEAEKGINESLGVR